MDTEADWRYSAEHISIKHGLTPIIANEALADPERLVIIPDPSSRSGESIRVIGYSPSASRLLTVIVVPADGKLWGASAWVANSVDQGRYWRSL